MERELWKGKLPTHLFPNEKVEYRLVARVLKTKTTLLGEVWDKFLTKKGSWKCCSPSIERFMMEQYIISNLRRD